MIPSFALMLALNGTGDPFEVGPVNLAMTTDSIISMLGPVKPVTICDSANYGYTDANATAEFEGIEVVLMPHPSALRRPTKAHPFVPPIAPLASTAPPIWSWRFMGYPVFAMADHLPGFITAKPRKGERLHLYRPGKTQETGNSASERIDYYLRSDGTVVIARSGWEEHGL